MRLPNPGRAVVDLDKLKGYCLNSQHEDGKHKARVFEAALGITQAALSITKKDAAWLRERLLKAAYLEARRVGTVRFGTLYVIDFVLRTAGKVATVRSGWIVRDREDFPRLTTCYVKKQK